MKTKIGKRKMKSGMKHLLTSDKAVKLRHIQNAKSKFPISRSRNSTAIDSPSGYQLPSQRHRRPIDPSSPLCTIHQHHHRRPAALSDHLRAHTENTVQ